MNLKNISNYELTQRLEKLVRTERKITHLVLLHIIEIEARKLYAEMGFDGMYTYLTRGLGYSEASAYRRLQAARLLKQVPSVAEKIESGALNLSQLTQVQKCLKEAARIGIETSTKRSEEILESLHYKNTFETQKTLAVEFNQAIQSIENIKPQADESVRIEVTLTAEQFQELEQAKNLLYHICPDGSWADVIGALAKKYNQKKLGKSKNEAIFDAAFIDKTITGVRCKETAGAELLHNASVRSITGSDSSHSSSNNNNNHNSENISKDSFTKSGRNSFLFKGNKENKENKENQKNESEKNGANGYIDNCINVNTDKRKSQLFFAEELPKSEIQIKTTQPVPAKTSKPIKRKYISVHTKRELLTKANHCCEYVDPRTQKKCQSKFCLEIDHIHPVALGGGDDVKNLRVLCRTHNSLAARQYGLSILE